MDWIDQTTAVVLPFALAGLLIGGAIVGTKLKPRLRRQSETYLLLPALVATLVALAGMAVFWKHNWLAMVGDVMIGGLVLARMLKRIREGARASAFVPLPEGEGGVRPKETGT